MISNHKLIIDKNCPMCNVYGRCFVKFKLLDESSIQHYQTIDQRVFDKIDKERAKSEVAFVDPVSGDIKYGVNAFLHILSHKSSFLRWLFGLKLVHFLALKLYRFISFNRHVMSGVGIVQDDRDCTPEAHNMYRWLYIFLGAVITGLVLNSFAISIDRELMVGHNSWREFLVCFGQIGWQFLFLTWLDKSKRLDYLGNMTTVSVIGGGLLLIVLLLDSFFILSLIQLLVSSAMIVSYMLLIHIKRSKKMGLSILTSVSWVSFRTVVLVLILIFMSWY